MSNSKPPTHKWSEKYKQVSKWKCEECPAFKEKPQKLPEGSKVISQTEAIFELMIKYCDQQREILNLTKRVEELELKEIKDE